MEIYVEEIDFSSKKKVAVMVAHPNDCMQNNDNQKTNIVKRLNF